MTIKELLKETVNVNDINTQIAKYTVGVNNFQKNLKQNMANIEDPAVSQKLSIEAANLDKMSKGVNLSFQELVKQNIQKKQEQLKNQAAQVGKVAKTAPNQTAPTNASGVVTPTPTANM